jgi:hypothetical protein
MLHQHSRGTLPGVDFRIIEASVFNPCYHDIVLQFLDACSEYRNCLNVQWLSNFNWIVSRPTGDIATIALGLIEDVRSIAEPFFRKVLSEPQLFQPCPKALFVSARGFSLWESGPWGVCQGKYPQLSTVIEITGYRQSIFHEFFHQLGASEGYDKKTRVTLKGCEDCWMQYDATKGSRLCQKHLDEVRGFLDSLKTSHGQ